MNNSFLHTFEEEGIYCVVSDGADYTYCVIKVVRTSKKTKTPTLAKEEPYCVYKYHKVNLDCETKNSKIYYTTDGSTPNKRSLVSLYFKFIQLFLKEIHFFNKTKNSFMILKMASFSEKRD
jgi:hypothetical protein